MAKLHLQDPHLSLAFGLLGNIVSILVFLAPLPTFYKIYKRKSVEGFQSIPYSVALFSCMLTLYYATLKTNVILLITINSIGFFIESFYLIIYAIYAPKATRIYTLKLLIWFNLGAFGVITLSTFLLISNGSQRTYIVGWICVVFSICVFAAPLSIIRKVMRTRSVEYMPFSLSFFLTLSAIFWFLYGISQADWFIAAPNIPGLIFGFAQMILYYIYKNKTKEILPETQSTQFEIPNVTPPREQISAET